MKSHLKKSCLFLAVCAGLVGGNLHAQVDIEYATYGSDSPATGATPVTYGGTYGATAGNTYTETLSTITVDNEVTSTGSSAYTYAFVQDSSGINGYIYLPAGASTLTVGGTYSGLVVDGDYYSSNEEFTLDASSPAGVLLFPGVGTPVFTPTAESSLTTTSTLSDLYKTNVATYTAPLDLEAVQFTLTPAANATLTMGKNAGVTITDVNGDIIDFFLPDATYSFVAGNTYTITGNTDVYKTGAEIVGATVVAVATPEPSTYLMFGLGAVGLMLFVRRRQVSV